MFKTGNFLFRREIIHYTGWQNLCREESRRREAGRTSAGTNPDGAGLAEPLPGRIRTARGWQNLCREESRRRGAGRISAGKNPRGFGQTRGLSLHAGANQCRGILIFHLSLPRANSGGTPACRDRPRVCPPPSVRQGRNKHVIRQTTNDCECIRLPRDGRTDTGKNQRGYRTDTGSVPT